MFVEEKRFLRTEETVHRVVALLPLMQVLILSEFVAALHILSTLTGIRRFRLVAEKLETTLVCICKEILGWSKTTATATWSLSCLQHVPVRHSFEDWGDFEMSSVWI